MELWKQANCAQPTIDGQAVWGWKMTVSGLEIDWCEKEILPHELVDILSGDQAIHEEENSDFELINLCDEIQQDVFDTEDTVDNSV